jgi:glutamate formiminotransferase/formiminotetrahydrofolate cyclodeaminase
MPQRLIECVPNFSEGRDRAKIEAIADAVRSVAGVRLLDIDPGADANRTVMTFSGPPEGVAEAAFRAIEKASEVIDMRTQRGSHPRIGATDVCPFVPLEDATMEECAEIARRVGRRVAEELAIPVYLYEAAAASPQRRDLAAIRKGEYEGLADKLRDHRWAPDFGKPAFNSRSGATVIGARDFLIAYNITLNTRDRSAAADIAFELRESGRVARTKTASRFYQHGEPIYYKEGSYPCGNCEFVGGTFAETEVHCRAMHGYELRELVAVTADDTAIVRKAPRAGKFKFCKAIGWYAESYKRAQISTNLTNFRVTPPHLVLEEARRLAADRGLVVTGSEVIGMIPFAALLEAGRFYLRRQGRSEHVPTADILETAVFSMGLGDVQPFDIARKVIGLPQSDAVSLTGRAVRDFVDEVSRDTVAPGGGSTAALAGALGAALASMAANVTHPRSRGDSERERLVLGIAEKAQRLKDELLAAIDADAAAYKAYLESVRMAAVTPAEEQLRRERVQDCLRRAVEVPYQTAVSGCRAMLLAREMVCHGLAAARADAAVGCEIAYVAVRGGTWNVLTNLKQIEDATYAASMRVKCAALLESAKRLKEENEVDVDTRLTQTAPSSNPPSPSSPGR